MQFKLIPAVKTFALCSITAAILSCNSTPQTTEEQQKDTSDSIKKENKQADLKPAGAAPAWGTDIKPEM